MFSNRQRLQDIEEKIQLFNEMVGQEQEDEKYIGSQLENLFQALLTQQTLFEQSLSKLSGDVEKLVEKVSTEKNIPKFSREYNKSVFGLFKYSCDQIHQKVKNLNADLLNELKMNIKQMRMVHAKKIQKFKQSIRADINPKLSNVAKLEDDATKIKSLGSGVDNKVRLDQIQVKQEQILNETFAIFYNKKFEMVTLQEFKYSMVKKLLKNFEKSLKTNQICDSLHIEEFTIITENNRDFLIHEANKKLKIERTEDTQYQNKPPVLNRRLTFADQEDRLSLGRITNEITEKDLEKFAHIKASNPRADIKLLHIIEKSRFFPPYCLNSAISFKNISSKMIQKTCTAFLAIGNVYNDYLAGNIVTDDDFIHVCSSYGYECSKEEQDLEYCSRLLLAHLFEILDKNDKSNRRFLSDCVFALHEIFGNKGKAKIKAGERAYNTVNRNEVHRVLSDSRRMSMGSSPNIPSSTHAFPNGLICGGIGQQINLHSSQLQRDRIRNLKTTEERFKILLLMFSFVWWNLEWKLFWRLWIEGGENTVEFRVFDRYIEFGLYKNCLEMVGDLLNGAFSNESRGISWINQIYEALQKLCSLHLQLSLGSKKGKVALETTNIDKIQLDKGLYDFCYPLNINLLEHGVLNLEEIVTQDPSVMLKTCKMLNLSRSSFYYWSFRTLWFQKYKLHIVMLGNEKLRARASKARIQEFGRFSALFMNNINRLARSNSREVRQIDALICTPVHMDLHHLIQGDGIYGSDKDVLKAIVKAVFLCYKAHHRFTDENRLFDLLMYYTMRWGMSQWRVLRKDAFGGVVEAAKATGLDKSQLVESKVGTIFEGNILDSCDEKTLSLIIDRFIEYIEEFKTKTLQGLITELDQYDQSQVHHRTRKLDKQLISQFYEGLLAEFKVALLKGLDKEAYPDFIKGIPFLLDELQRLELYVKTLNLQGNQLGSTIEKLVNLWLIIFKEELSESIAKIQAREAWKPIDENGNYSDGIVDFMTLVNQYINTLDQILRDEVIKEKIQEKINLAFIDVFSDLIDFITSSVQWIQSKQTKFLDCSLEDIEQFTITEGPPNNPSERDLQIAVQSLEQVTVRLANLNYLITQLKDPSMKQLYRTVITDEKDLKKIIKKAERSKKVVLQKIALQFWDLIMFGLFLKYLYFDYGLKAFPNTIVNSKSDVLKVMSLAEDMVPGEDAKEVIKELMKYTLNEISMRIAKLVLEKKVIAGDSKAAEDFEKDLNCIEEISKGRTSIRIDTSMPFLHVESFVNMITLDEASLKKKARNSPIGTLMVMVRNPKNYRK